jgi:hypothetical protein
MNNLKLTIITIILGLTLSAPVFAMGKADLTLSPASGEHQVGETFNVSIAANANEETVDTVRAKVNFPADKLEIANFTFGDIYSYPAGGNAYDNNAGTLSQGAGHPGGTTQSGTFGTIVFKAKAIGKATVTISSDSLMISAGEDKFTGKSFSASYNLTAPPPPPKKEEKVKESADVPSLEEGTMADKEIKEIEIEEETEISEEENQDDLIISPSEEETFGNETEENNKETSDKTWMIITVILSVFFGLAGYYYGRSKNKIVRRKF